MAIDNSTMKVVKLGMKAFLTYWEEKSNDAEQYEVDPVTGKTEVRNPETAMEMLFNYIETRKRFLSTIRLIAVERPFAVPLDPDNPHLIYVGRLDKVYEQDRGIYVGEHKTTSSYRKNGPFRNDFIDSFSPNSQIDGYIFSASIEYGPRFKGVNVDAALVHDIEHDGFRFIPATRQFAQISGWLWETQHWVAQIRANERLLLQDTSFKTAEYLPAFPKNTNACTLYGNCPYMDLCKMWANPHREDVPSGFAVKPWSPFDELELANAKDIIGVKGKLKKKDELYDNTRVSCFKMCPRRYYFRHIRHWETIADRRPLLFGGGWHAAMDVVWQELAPNWNDKPSLHMKEDDAPILRRPAIPAPKRTGSGGPSQKADQKVGSKVPWFSATRSFVEQGSVDKGRRGDRR